jgi:hypothetical protein
MQIVVAGRCPVGAIPPLMLQTGANPGGLPIEVFDDLRDGLTADRSQFYAELSAPFYSADREGSIVSQGPARRVLADVHERQRERRPPSTASRPSPRPTSPKTSRDSCPSARRP